jgi:hypothetical protein
MVGWITSLGVWRYSVLKRIFLVLVVTLLMAQMTGTAAGAAWAQNQAVCDGSNEGDHGRGCLPPTKEECKGGAWEAFKVFEYLFEKVDVCN